MPVFPFSSPEGVKRAVSTDSLIVSGLTDPRLVVEIEAEAAGELAAGEPAPGGSA